MPAAVAIPAIIGAATSVGQGVIQGRAAGSAARTQQEAAAEAARRSQAEADRSSSEILGAGETAATNVGQASTEIAGQVLNAGQRSAARVGISAEEANAILRQIYGDSMDSLKPYSQAGGVALGQLTEMAGPGGSLSQRYGEADMKLDPGYEFRLKEGQKALERSAAARGSLQGGATLKALARYSQGVASDEYGKAFDRFRAERGDRLGVLGELLGVGTRATERGVSLGETFSGRTAGNLVHAGDQEAQYGYRAVTDAGDMSYRGVSDASRIRLGSVGDAASIRMSGVRAVNAAEGEGADAKAAGTVARGRAFSGTLGAIGGLASDAYSEYDYQKNDPYSAYNRKKAARPRGTGSVYV